MFKNGIQLWLSLVLKNELEIVNHQVEGSLSHNCIWFESVYVS